MSLDIHGATVLDHVDSDGGDDDSSTTSSSDDSPKAGGGGLARNSGSMLSKHSSTSSLKERAKERLGKRLPPRPAHQEQVSEDLQNELASVIEHMREVANFGQLSLTNEQVPRAVTTASHLTELCFAENRISFIDHTFFSNLLNLVKVDLSNNCLVVIPESLFKLPSVEVVLLDHNQIREVPRYSSDDQPFFMPRLLKLGLAWNQLDAFPLNLVEAAPHLEHFYVNENPRLLSVPSPVDFARAPRHGQTLTVVVDNRPQIMQAIGDPVYSDVHVRFEVNKIYPDRVNDLPFVFLGSVRTAQCVEVYKDLDVNYVLTCGRKLDPVIEEGMCWKELPLDDLPSEDISPFFEDAIAFIDEALQRRRGVLIHCFAGLSRSVAVTIAYLMRRKGMTRDEALARIRETRPAAHPNAGFVATLGKYEQELRAQGIINH